MNGDWSQITEHFAFFEFFQPEKSGRKIYKLDIVKVFYLCTFLLEPLRAYGDNPILITSGKRSAKHNKLIGGAPNSDHLFREECAACDFTLQDKSLNRQAGEWLGKNRSASFGQLIFYDDDQIVRWLHVSLPSRRHIGKAFTIKIDKEGRKI